MKYAKAVAAATGVFVLALQQTLPGDAIWTNKYVSIAIGVLTIFGVYRVPNEKPPA